MLSEQASVEAFNHSSKIFFEAKEQDLPNLVEIFPKVHAARVGTKLVQIGAEEQLAVQDLGAVLVRDIVHRALEAGGSRGEGPGRDVVA